MGISHEEQKRNRETWAKALDSGKFKQTNGELGTLEAGMCCLGVGCFVLGVKFNYDDSFPPVEFAQLVGLPYDEDYIHENQIDGVYEGGSLVTDNDEYKLTFPEIAHVIRNVKSLWVESDYHQSGMLEAKKQAEEMLALDDNGLDI